MPHCCWFVAIVMGGKKLGGKLPPLTVRFSACSFDDDRGLKYSDTLCSLVARCIANPNSPTTVHLRAPSDSKAKQAYVDEIKSKKGCCLTRPKSVCDVEMLMEDSKVFQGCAAAE
jgi:hypothetical protein